MGSDGLVDLDQDTWIVLAKYNLLLATAFAVVALGVRTASPEQTLLVVENGVLAACFGGLQTYCWISA